MKEQELKNIIDKYVKDRSKIPLSSLNSDGINPAKTILQYSMIEDRYHKADAISNILNNEDACQFFRLYWDIDNKINYPKIYAFVGFNEKELIIMDLVNQYDSLLGKIPDPPDMYFLTEKYYC